MIRRALIPRTLIPRTLIRRALLAAGLLALATLLRPAKGVAPVPDDCRTVGVTAGGRRLVGIEDIALDPGRGQALLSAHDRRADPGKAGGGLFLLDRAALEKAAAGAAVVEARDLAAAVPEGVFRPHGIDLRAEPDGGRSVLAVNRRADGTAVVERFALEGGRLLHRGTVAGPALCRANDVAFLDGDRFLFTSSHGGCGWGDVLRENVLGRRHGFVGLVEGPVGAETVHRLAGGIGFANGILPVPAADRLYVAATRERALLVYRLSALLAGGAGPEPEPERVPTPGGPDNLSAAPDGGVLMALHPSLPRLALHRYGWPGGGRAPSRVARLGPEGLSVLVDEDGRRFSAATVAVAWAGRLLMGSVTADGLLLCGASASAATRS